MSKNIAAIAADIAERGIEQRKLAIAAQYRMSPKRAEAIAAEVKRIDDEKILEGQVWRVIAGAAMEMALMKLEDGTMLKELEGEK